MQWPTLMSRSRRDVTARHIVRTAGYELSSVTGCDGCLYFTSESQVPRVRDSKYWFSASITHLHEDITRRFEVDPARCSRVKSTLKNSR